MDNLIFSLNATIPVFLTMLMGVLFRTLGLFDENTVSRLTKFVFKAALPVALFQDMATADFKSSWDTRFVLYCFFATLLSITLAAVISFFLKNKNHQGEFIQASYRSSASILGMAFVINIYGHAGMIPLMIIGSVPLYNIMAVLILSIFKPGHKALSKQLLKQTFLEILTNPILLGIAGGMFWALCKLPQPVILTKTLDQLGSLATPLGLMTLGASVNFKKALAGIRPVLLVCFLKLVCFCGLFLPIAMALDFRESALASILIMLGSPTTISCFIMAKNMGHEGDFSSTAVMLSTLLSAFTLTGWLYVLKTLGYV